MKMLCDIIGMGIGIKQPLPFKALAIPACCTRLRSVLTSLVNPTMSTISPCGGSMTFSMTWITPLEACLSNSVIVEP